MSDYEDKKNITSVAEKVENGEILTSSSEWYLGSDRVFFVTCLKNCDEIGKPIKICLNLFINTTLN